MRLSGVVLAGGLSSRMGVDKATLSLGGCRMVDTAVSILDGVCDDVMVAAGDRALEVHGARTVADAPCGGPLAGIVGALRAAAHPLLAVIAVDMPDANAGVLRALARRWKGECGVAPVVGDVVQPLHAVYATSWAERYEALLAGGERSPRNALVVLGALLAGPEVWRPLDPEGAFARSLNHPADVAAYRRAPRSAG